MLPGVGRDDQRSSLRGRARTWPAAYLAEFHDHDQGRRAPATGGQRPSGRYLPFLEVLASVAGQAVARLAAVDRGEQGAHLPGVDPLLAGLLEVDAEPEVVLRPR